MWMLVIQFPAGAASLELGSRTILVYETESGGEKRQLVLRIARFKPDIVLEWESLSHQGTIHLHKKAVEKATRFSASSLFDAGVDIDTDREMIKWLSRKTYNELVEKGEIKITLSRIATRFRLREHAARRILIDKVESEIAVIVVEDNRRGVWMFHADPENPLLVSYTTPYYNETLLRVSTDKNNRLRWIRQLPPIR